MPSADAKNKQLILVVDDEQVILELLQRHLSGLGFEVMTCLSGEDALARGMPALPSLVFLDIKMPGMGGLECLREIRLRHPSVPVIMLTAIVDREAVLKAADYGVNDYLFKPIDLDSLTKMVRRQLSLRRNA